MNSTRLLWNDDLLIGHEETDREHRELVTLAGELQNAIAANAPPKELRERCAALLACARRNFIAEEGLMLASGYPDYAAHRQEHQRLLEQLTFIQENVTAVNAGELLLTLVTAWTVPHIRFADKHLAVFLAGSR